MIERYIRLVVVFALVLTFMVARCCGVVFTGNRFADVFLHINEPHLLACCFCFWSLLRGLPWPSWVMLAVALPLGVLGSVVSPWPVQGTSGVLFALSGIVLAYYYTNKRFLQSVALSIVFATAVFPRSIVVHAVPLVLGFVVALIVKSWKYHR